MANIKSAIKNIRKSQKNRKRNLNYKSKIKRLTRSFSAALKSNKEEALGIFKNLASAIDKAALKKIIHRNKAARHISRFQKLLLSK